jgi:TolB-like protein
MVESNELDALKLILDLDEIDLARYRVVGGIVRYDQSARNSMKDSRQKITTSILANNHGRENFLIWAPPGSGKSFFVQEVAKSLGDSVEYRELNLAKLDEREFRAKLSEIERIQKPRLCFVDEVDSKPSEGWPYEAMLPSLEPSDSDALRTCFVLAGSSGDSLTEMKERISKRPKGSDLLSRIARGNEFVVPQLGLGDKLLVLATQILGAARESGKRVNEVEKLVLYYVALNPQLTSARQIRQLAVRCVERMPPGEERVKYDYLFDAGDPENKEFWIKAQPRNKGLVNAFVSFSGLDQLQGARAIDPPPGETKSEQQPRVDSHRIAVLPFANISPDPKDEYFADGMTDEIISTVSGISGLSVISRTSAMRYKQTSKSLTEIGRELKAGKLLEGSVRKSGNRIRITVQLIDAESDAHLWAQSYDRNMEDIFETQSEIARKIADALKLPSPRAGGHEESPDAYTLYLRARSLLEQEDQGGERAGDPPVRGRTEDRLRVRSGLRGDCRLLHYSGRLWMDGPNSRI